MNIGYPINCESKVQPSPESTLVTDELRQLDSWYRNKSNIQ